MDYLHRKSKLEKMVQIEANPLPCSFLIIEYQKTELAEDNGFCIIVVPE